MSMRIKQERGWGLRWEEDELWCVELKPVTGGWEGIFSPGSLYIESTPSVFSILLNTEHGLEIEDCLTNNKTQ